MTLPASVPLGSATCTSASTVCLAGSGRLTGSHCVPELGGVLAFGVLEHGAEPVLADRLSYLPAGVDERHLEPHLTDFGQARRQVVPAPLLVILTVTEASSPGLTTWARRVQLRGALQHLVASSELPSATWAPANVIG